MNGREARTRARVYSEHATAEEVKADSPFIRTKEKDGSRLSYRLFL